MYIHAHMKELGHPEILQVSATCSAPKGPWSSWVKSKHLLSLSKTQQEKRNRKLQKAKLIMS